MLYNLLSSILRAVGDTKTSLVALIVASGINIVLDILFVVYLRSGVTGVAVATLIAQVFSCLVCSYSIANLTGKVTNLLQQTGVSFSITLSTYVGQNLGAHKLARIREEV